MNALQRLHAGKAFGDVVEFENRVHRVLLCRPGRAVGRAATTRHSRLPAEALGIALVDHLHVDRNRLRHIGAPLLRERDAESRCAPGRRGNCAEVSMNFESGFWIAAIASGAPSTLVSLMSLPDDSIADERAHRAAVVHAEHALQIRMRLDHVLGDGQRGGAFLLAVLRIDELDARALSRAPPCNRARVRESARPECRRESPLRRCRRSPSPRYSQDISPAS